MRIGAAMLAAASLWGCGASDETGIDVSIEPDPVPASRLSSASDAYQASWTVAITELSGNAGTLDALDLQIRSATGVTELPSRDRLTSGSALAGFSRSFVQQTVRFQPTSGQPSVVVTARFTDETGKTSSATAEARIELR